MTKFAVIDIDTICLAEASRVIDDHGLAVIGSLDTGFIGRKVRLVIGGAQLADECGDQHPLKVVRITMKRSTYGSQGITSIDKIEVIG